MIGGAAFVGKERRFADHAEAVREAFGDVQLSLVFTGEDEAGRVTEGGGSGADVDRDVKDFSLRTAMSLALRVRVLKMQPAQRAAYREGDVILDEPGQAGSFVALLLETLEEKTARVPKDAWLDDANAGELGLEDVHGLVSMEVC